MRNCQNQKSHAMLTVTATVSVTRKSKKSRIRWPQVAEEAAAKGDVERRL